ncbi:hypothetical protein GW17_00028018 [Ensete ventricosum]|nr:hypothetical protein GW17_00028018 [Ensete ventricosum]
MEEGPIAEEEKKGGNNEKKREGKKREEESSSPRRGGCCWLGRTYLGRRAMMTKEREGIVRGEERRKKQREGEERGGIGAHFFLLPTPQSTLRLAQLDKIAERLSRHVMEHHEEMGMFLICKLGLKIKDCNFDLYCPVRVLRTGPPCYRYADRPLLGTIAKIDRRRSIEGEIGRRRSIEGKKGKKKKKRKRRKEGRRKKYLTPSLPADRPWAVAALARTRFFSRARRRNVSPCGEKDRGDGEGGYNGKEVAMQTRSNSTVEKEKNKKAEADAHAEGEEEKDEKME